MSPASRHVSVRRSTEPRLRKREQRLARISLLIVMIFITCHSVKNIPTVFEIFGKDPRVSFISYHILYHILYHMLCYIFCLHSEILSVWYFFHFRHFIELKIFDGDSPNFRTFPFALKSFYSATYW